MQHSCAELQAQLHVALQHLQAIQQQTDRETVAQELYVRGVEERAYREVDTVREGRKARQVERRELQRQLTDARQALEVCRTALTESQLEVATQLARTESAMEQGACEKSALQVRAETAEQALVEAQRDSATDPS